MKRFLFAIMALGISSLACQLSQPTATSTPVDAISIQVTNATMIYYEVTGSTADELRIQMNQQGPMDIAEGRHYDSRTDWYVSWTWPGYGTSECDLAKVDISYDIKVTAPNWEPASGTDPKLIEQWNRYLHNLALHEQGHVDNIVNNYLRVKDVIQGATCSTAEQAAQELLDTFRSADLEYDKQTKHGETQGAIFP